MVGIGVVVFRHTFQRPFMNTEVGCGQIDKFTIWFGDVNFYFSRFF